MGVLSTMQNLNKIQGYEDVFQDKDITSDAMKSAVRTWMGLYYDDMAVCGSDSAQRIPYVIVDGVYNAAFGEYTASISGKSGKDKLLGQTVANLNDEKPEAFQQTLIGGEGFIKPVVENGNFVFTYVNRTGFIVFARNTRGDITDVGTAQQWDKGKAFYTLYERRTVDGAGYLTIRNLLTKSDSKNAPGTFVPLSSIPETAGLVPELTLPIPMDNLGLIPLRMPISNCVDGSKDGVSVYAAAAKKILTQYWQENRTQDEFEVTVPALYMSEDEFETDSYGRPIIPKYARAIDDMPSNVGRFTYNPSPNQEELEARSEQNLRDIENIIGLRRGFLAHVDTEERTATEVISSSSKFAQVVALLQAMWSEAVNETVRTCDLLGQMYLGWDATEYTPPVIDWGNGVLYDEQQDFDRNLALTREGYQKPEYIVGWVHGMPTDTPEEQEEVRVKYMPAASPGIFDE